jgi:hypothetical protein
MGHYHEQYETQRIIDEQDRRERLLVVIKKNIEQLDNDQLGVVHEVSNFPNQYLSLFKIIGRIGKTFK